MKKLILGKGVETRHARCNWCQEWKECARAVEPTTVWCYESKTHLEWLRTEKAFSHVKLWWVADNQNKPSGEFVKKEAYTYICKDCAKQLAKLL